MTLSHYEVVEEVGRGGMGVVYKARDTRLGRTVALKLLPVHLSGDKEAKARFLQEGRTASVLDHSSICTVYDVGETEDGQLFMAMAFVEGQSLSDLIAERPLDLARALDVAVAVGEGLEHSHKSGVVHRDMKPGNVMISESGDVKILDFGLARLQGASLLTASGTTLGTAAYMSPEQAQGQKVDQRTDIWALGVMLYEMVAGVRPFKGEYQHALTYSIVNEHAEPLTALRTGLPLELDRVVAKALMKDPASRYQHVEELVVDLKNLRATISSGDLSAVQRSTQPHSRNSWALPVAVVVAGLLVAASILFGLLSGSDQPGMSLSLTIETQAIPVDAHPLAPPLAVSPDGSTVVYARRLGGSSVLVRRDLDSFRETELEGTEGGHTPFFSPDGSWVGFMTDSEVRKVSLENNDVFTVARAPSLVHGAAWGADGNIYVGLVRSLAVVPASGGELRRIAHTDTLDQEQFYLVWPEVLAGGEHLLGVTGNASGRNNKVWAIQIADGSRQFIAEGGYAAVVDDRYLVTTRDGALWAMRFDPRTLEVQSAPTRVLEDVLGEFAQEPGLALFDVSRSGTLVFVPPQASSGQYHLSWVDEDGNVEIISSEPGPHLGISISPQGNRIATTTVKDGTRRVVVFDVERQMWSTLSTTPEDHFWPHWAPDGESILMTYGLPPDQFVLAEQRVGSTAPKHLIVDSFGYQVSSWIPGTGEALLQRSVISDLASFDIVRFRAGSEPQELVATARIETHPVASPNGKWLAFTSAASESGGVDESAFQVYVRPLESPEPLMQVSETDGVAPRWSPDGRQLYFESRSGMMAAAWSDPETMSPGRPRHLFNIPFAKSLEYGINYDVGPDGRLLMLTTKSEVRNIRIVTNWIDKLDEMLAGS
jgi:serine/threonine-protein kinase